jgi:hypothetical protein
MLVDRGGASERKKRSRQWHSLVEPHGNIDLGGKGGFGVCSWLCFSACLRNVVVPVVAKYFPSTVVSKTLNTNLMLLQRQQQWDMGHGTYLALWGRSYALAVDAHSILSRACPLVGAARPALEASLLLGPGPVYVMAMEVNYWLVNIYGFSPHG